jgi:hypothetical protein
MRIGGERGDSDICEGLDCFEAIQTLSYEDKVRVQCGDGFDAGIDGAADLFLLLRFWWEIAIVCVSDEMVL